MKICLKCGQHMADEAKFCDNCGQPLGETQAQDPAKDSSYGPSPYGADGQTQILRPAAGPAEAEPAARADGTPGQAMGGASYQDFANGAGQVTAGPAHPTPNKGKKKSPPTFVFLACILAIVAFMFLTMRPSGWSEEDAQKATQAYLDAYMKGDFENLANYMDDTTKEELEKEWEESKEEAIADTFTKVTLSSDSLRRDYVDFYRDLRKKSRYSVGESTRTEDGFEVAVAIEPILSLSKGDFVGVDLQLNDDLPQADLNERFYGRELELMKELTRNPTYGEAREMVMHISRDDDGKYVFSQEDFSEIIDAYYMMDRHWTSERAEKAVEAILGAVFQGKYAEMAEWTIATREEIEDAVGGIMSSGQVKEAITKTGKEIISSEGVDEDYEASDAIAEKVSDAYKRMMASTHYEIEKVDGGGAAFEVRVKVVPYTMDVSEEEIGKRLAEEADSISNMGMLIDFWYGYFAESMDQAVEEGRLGTPVYLPLHLTYNENDAYELDIDEWMAFYGVYNWDEAVEESAGVDDGEATLSRKYASGAEIPVKISGQKIRFGETTLQDLLDATGLSLRSDAEGKVVAKGELDYVDIDMHDEDRNLTLWIENKSGTEEKHAEACRIYGISYMDFGSVPEGEADVVSVGGLHTGATEDEVKAVFGEPDSETDDWISYSFDDGEYDVTFYVEDGAVDSLDVTVYSFW